MKSRILASTLLLVSLLINLTFAADYPGSLKKRVKKALGPDFDKYEWFSYPTDNFGIATAFVLKDPKERPGPTNQLCATFTCLGMLTPTDPELFLTANGYAEVGKGGPIRLTEKDKSELTFESVLPHLLRAVGVNTSLSRNALITSTLTLGAAYKRYLNYDRWFEHIRSLPESAPLKRALANHQLALVISDAVIESMQFDIKVNNSLAAEIHAKLGEKETAIIGEGSNFQVKVSKMGETEYQFEVNRPVIVCRLLARQPLHDELFHQEAVEKTSKIALPLSSEKFQRYITNPQLKDWAYWKPLKSKQ
ncbi:MAG TPA: hypothetical protein VJ124_11410 [Pyrinomonadaceae bacterium]|nr:hypothetical protein [Pyrinomonadaceae bacterium]